MKYATSAAIGIYNVADKRQHKESKYLKVGNTKMISKSIKAHQKSTVR